MICTLLAVSGLEKTSTEFRAELCRVAQRLGTSPDYLSAVMSVESKFNPAIKNPLSGATGLIQFMPSTAKRLGTTTSDLARMTATEQLAYVEKYFKQFAGHLSTEEDVYMVVFCPAGLGKGSDNILAVKDGDAASPCGAKSSVIYSENSGLDSNQDGTITNHDVGNVVRSVLAKAAAAPPIAVDVDMSVPPQVPKPSTGASSLLLIAAFGTASYVGWELAKRVRTRVRSRVR